jgi:long-chain fatty acid transport protein
MARGIFKLVTAALAVSAATAASAGGFSRGTADTDIIFEEGNFNLRAGATYVSPQRKYSSYGLNPNFVGYDPYQLFAIPTAAIKLNLTDDLRCAGSYTQPYGGSTKWPIPFGATRKRSESFTVDEGGLTCGYKFDLGKGRAWLLGGVFVESFNYDLVAGDGALRVNLGSSDIGFRLGAAYEIPEIALRLQGMYRSGTRHDATGFGNGVLPATGDGDLPQSFELKAQSGIAPGWLGFVNVKWTDWSVTDRINLSVPAVPGVFPGVNTANIYNWKDGWTVTAGVGHAFTEKLSGAAQITWDSGVGTGWDLSSDVWTLGLGASYKPDMGGEMRLGTGLSYLTSAKETKYAAPDNASVGGGWAIAFSGSYKVNW